MLNALRRLNRPRVYTARHGLGKGFKQIGGAGLLLPDTIHNRREEFREHVAREQDFLRSLELRGMTVFDVGSFHGIVALLFARKVGPDGRVVAFEPHPASFARLSEHMRLNGIENVTAINAGIGARDGELRLAGEEGRASGSVAIQRSMAAGSELETRTVPVRAIDSLTAGELPDPAFVKIDVEGMEEDVLRGMTKTIERARPQLYVEMHGATEAAKAENARRVVELLNGHGYELRHVQSGEALGASNSDAAKRGHIYAR